MSEFVERRVGRYTIRIDRDLCVGFGDCVTEAPELFELGADGIVLFVADDSAQEQRALAACRACPVDALTALDENDRVIAP
jgi:ferredoxin